MLAPDKVTAPANPLAVFTEPAPEIKLDIAEEFEDAPLLINESDAPLEIEIGSAYELILSISNETAPEPIAAEVIA